MENVTNRKTASLQGLELACQLTQLSYEKEIGTSLLELAPSQYKDIAASDNWKSNHDSNGRMKNMRWKDIYNKQKRRSRRFMCTVRDAVTKEIVGFIAGKYSPLDTDGSRVSIDYVERDQNSTKSKGHMIALAIRLAYILGLANQATSVKVNNPAKGLERYYHNEMPGSKFEKRNNHCFIVADIDNETMNRIIQA